MPRPKSIIVDDQTILAAIQTAYNAATADEARLEAEGERHAYWESRRQRGGWECVDGIRCDLKVFWGREPTPSERIRLQQCIRRLEAAGKVERSTIYIRPVQAAEVPSV